MKNSILFFFFFVSITSLFSQENNSSTIPPLDQNESVQLLYRNEQEFGGVIHSSGWGFNYRRSKHYTGYIKRTLELELVGMHHPKEIKSEFNENGGKGFFYGKQYVVTVLRGGWGYHKIITGKSERKGVELRLVTLGGPCMAFAKPVYLDIWNRDLYSENGTSIERYDPQNPKHVPANILGRENYFQGFGKMDFFPGLFFKFALSFEHSNLDDEIKLFETGVIVDAFYKTIPIMANTHNNQVYVNLYINFMFGKKWF